MAKKLITPEKMLALAMERISTYFHLEYKLVDGHIGTMITLIASPPNLPPELYKKYKSRYVAIQIGDGYDMLNPKELNLLLEETADKMAYEIMDSLLRKHPKKT